MIIFPEDNLINYVSTSNDFVASHEFLNREIGEFDRVQPLSDDMTVREYRQRQEENLVAMNNNIVLEGLRKMFLREEQEEHDWEEALKIELLPCPCCGGKARLLDLADSLQGKKSKDVYSYDLAKIKNPRLRDLFFHAVVNSNIFTLTSRPRGIFCERCHAFLPANHNICLEDVWFGIFADEHENWNRAMYNSEMNRICVSLWNGRGEFKSKGTRQSRHCVEEETPCPICGSTLCKENPADISLMIFMQCLSCGFETVGIDGHSYTYDYSDLDYDEMYEVLNWQRNCELVDKNKLRKFKQEIEHMYCVVRKIFR